MAQSDTVPPQDQQDPLQAALDREEETPLKLLLVTPDTTLQKGLIGVFDSVGLSVTPVSDAESALELARREPFTVVIADTELPDASGAALVRTLGEIDQYIECVLLSGGENLDLLTEAVEEDNLYNHFWKPLHDLGDLVRCAVRAAERHSLRKDAGRLVVALRDTQEELNGLKRRMEQLDRVALVGQMTGAIAAHLEAPLKNLIAYAQYLNGRLERDGAAPLTDEQLARLQEYLQEMEGDARTCQEVVQEIRDYAREQEERAGPTSLNDVLGTALKLVRHTMDAQGITITLESDVALPPVLANPRRLQQVFMSLLLNAQQALGKSGGSIALAIAAQNDAEGRETGAVIRIRDSGPGIDAETLARVFDPFFTTRPQSESLGLGLTVARSMVREWDGEITLESAPGTGTTVSLTLPFCTEILVTPGMAPESVPNRSAA